MTVSNIKLIETGDGSHTLYNSQLNETYHSSRGAVTESYHVFIHNGINLVPSENKNIRVLEIGFGTGLNALLVLKQSRLLNKKIYYSALEPFPLGKEIYSALNYPDYVNGTSREDLNNLHEGGWGENIYSEEFFQLNKFRVRLEDFETEQQFDVIFYDAFAPSKQKDVWDLNNIKKACSLLKDKGILTTYCASGQFRRDLKSAGFIVESLPGPPGKKEMTLARKV